MLNELKQLRRNAEIVANTKITSDTPMFFFISSEQSQAVPGWDKALSSYITNVKNGDFLILETGHYMHHDKADRIAKTINLFLDEL